MDVTGIVDGQRRFFKSGATRELFARRQALRHLRAILGRHENEILEALKQDMRKPGLEAFLGEVSFLYDEIAHTLRHLERWAKPRRVGSPLLTAFSRSRIYSEPKGVVLVLGPWNYPFQLVVAPLIGALAAGNTAVLKPSELAPHTSALLGKMFKQHFDPQLVAVVEGGVEASQALLDIPFDHIFFTGGTQIGKVVMAAAAKHLTPITLELGGKSPCILDEETDWETTLRRVTWGKFFNAGQTCVAPDYLLVPENEKARVVEGIRASVKSFFGSDPSHSPDYARIINTRHFDRLSGLLGEAPAVIGGETKRDELYLAPTVIADAKAEHRVMADEIFGPILPILTYRKLDEAIEFVNARPRPLALYFFSKNAQREKKVLETTSFGGGCINDTLIHLSNPNLPFGGVGPSGLGAYHGKFSFDTFSHQKGVLHRSFSLDPSLRYPPYGDRLRWLRKILG